MSGGSTYLQTSWANWHLGWNRHPDGGFFRSGGEPGIDRSRRRGPLMLGNAERRPIVYGFADFSKTSLMFPYSNSFPAYMMPIFSPTSATTEMSCVMISIAT